MSQAIRTGIIGYGRTAQQLHAPGLKANPAFSVRCAAVRSDENQAAAQRDFGCPVFSDYRQMLKEAELDLVVILTRSDQHAPMACDVLKHGAHVLVTKPLGINLAEVEEIYTAADVAGRKVFPFQPARWGSDFRKLGEIIRSGEIGKVFAIRRSVYGFATRDDWQTQTAAGGGIVLNWGGHLIEPPIRLAGGKPKHVFGSCAQVLNSGDAEDIFYAVVTMDSGVRVHAEWSFAPQNLPNWFVQGARGSIVVHGTEITVHAGDPAKPSDPTDHRAMTGGGLLARTETVADTLYGDTKEIYADVVRDLEGGKPYPVSRQDALELMTTMDAIKQSHAESKLIQIV